jgi:ankyrin repeat protein
MSKIHDSWRAALEKVQKIGLERGWSVTKLKVHPAAKAAELARVEKKLGRPLPKQLRAALEWAARVDFGWSIPPAKAAGAAVTIGGLGRSLWDIKTIEASPTSLERWLRLADGDDDFEAKHSRTMWDGHLVFASLPNGDLLTIDASKSGAQPVRYFSHEIEGLHGKVLAPDFDGFMAAYTQLGAAGATHDDWIKLGVKAGKPLGVGTAQAKAWLAWLATGVAVKPKLKPDQTPRPVKAVTPADKALLAAAKAGKIAGVEAALAAGADIDSTISERNVPHSAVDFAAMRSNLPLLELLVARGATVQTPMNALSVAAVHGDVRLMKWFLDRGCHPGTRSNDRDSPLEQVLEATVNAGAADMKRLLGNLECLLAAGVEPDSNDAGRDDLFPILARGDVATIPILLRHGADPNHGSGDGFTPLHCARSKAQVLALAKAGARPNASWKGTRDDPGRTPLQWALTQDDLGPGTIEAMLQIGCDPKVPDSDGKTAFYYCMDLARAKLILKGFKPGWTDKDGNTLLHVAVGYTMLELDQIPALVAYLVKDFKIPVDAQNKAGDTALHIAVKNKDADLIRALKNAGASTGIKNKKGRMAA